MKRIIILLVIATFVTLSVFDAFASSDLQQMAQKYSQADTACSNFVAAQGVPRISLGYSYMKGMCLRTAVGYPDFVEKWFAETETIEMAMRACEANTNRQVEYMNLPAGYTMYGATEIFVSCITKEMTHR